MAPTGKIGDHRLYVVSDHTKNPTAREDSINDSLPEASQFPPAPPPVRYHYGEEGVFDLLADSTAYAEMEYTEGGTLLRCDRARYPTLESAQAFFGLKRIEFKWHRERPIFRTARFWCKRVYERKPDGPR